MNKNTETVLLITLIFVLLGSLILTHLAEAKHLNTEKFYQTIHCNQLGGQMEVIMPDRSRCDCLTETYAIEHDFANSPKMYEGVSQALLYSAHTGKKPGLALIVEDKKDADIAMKRLRLILKRWMLPIHIWLIINDGSDNITIEDLGLLY